MSSDGSEEVEKPDGLSKALKDDSDSLSDNESSKDEEYFLKKHARELEIEISKNPYAYNAYVQLIEVYKKLLNLSEVRSAYERFSKYYPLTGKLWLGWIEDEIRVANTENEKNNVLKLFEKAVEDYLSVELWLEYVQFGIGFKSEITREIFERAVNAAGLHFLKGSLIWDAYREYELAVLSTITDIESDEWKEQVLKVNEIFKRQLSVPLMEMERTFIEWRVWVKRLPKYNLIVQELVEWSYKKSTKFLENNLDYENKLLETNNDDEKLEIYRQYISNQRKPEYMRSLYERAVSEFSLNGELWLEYCMYYFKLKNYETALKTCGRALRNCYDADLWVLNIRLLEISGKNHDEVTQCLEKSFSYQLPGESYLKIWLAYLDHFRRITDPNEPEQVEKLRKAFEKGQNYLSKSLTDPECSFLRFWAKIEASFLKSPDFRSIFFNITKILGSSANCWLEFLNLEQQYALSDKYGDETRMKKTYQRALKAVKDWPQSIIDHWINYERSFGSVESMINCEETCRVFLKKWQLEHPVYTEVEENKPKSNQRESFKRKRKNEQKDSMERAQKQVKIDQESIEDEFKKIDIDKQERSVFLCNLSFTATEEEIKEFLGPVDEFRLVKNRFGKSRGFAYCVFSSEIEAQNAIKRDRELLNGRPVFISKCTGEKSKRERNFARDRTIFVRGLPYNMSKEEVEELFKNYGEIQEVRVKTNSNDTSRRYAHVRYKSVNDAKKAIIATDNLDVQGSKISVEIDRAAIRKSKKLDTSRKNKLQIPLVPRVVQAKTSTETSQPSQSLSNEDFRNMLLNNK